MEELGQDQCLVSEYGLREGVLVDLAQKTYLACPNEEKFNLAQKKVSDGDAQGALILFKELVFSNPGYAAYQIMLAKTYQDLGDLENASMAFQNCVGLYPEKEIISKCLFHCLLKQGKREEAIKEANRFLSIKRSEDYQKILKEVGGQST